MAGKQKIEPRHGNVGIVRNGRFSPQSRIYDTVVLRHESPAQCKAVEAKGCAWSELRNDFGMNFHVRQRPVFEHQKDRLVLVKGNGRSRLLRKARRISVLEKNRAGIPIHVLSPEMRKVFGDFNGHVSIHRSPPRFVSPEFVEKAARFVRSLR